MLRNLLALHHVSQRTISSTSQRSLQNKVADKQKLFQEDNGVPVYLKGGVGDALLYRLTMALTVLGTGYALYQLFDAAMPKKKK
ncbi:cytochrome c oxidase subunit 7A2, mitochondrial-like [Bombina bombina]|uniref:cytochrome c oxidase subunit 7A2, mitochondrial-like n=1 Tax=Bombina bombina TaxID=8345 RepID=UPI00235AA679|nr:cytochrome c oxidase subunit 7A2, mitochondrial-like [Bombina bombina]